MELGTRGGAGVWAQETGEERVRVLLSSMGALGGPPTCSSSPPGGGLRRELRRVRALAMAWLKSKNFFF